MAETATKRTFASNDLLYLVTFALGIAALWLGGKVNLMLPAQHTQQMAYIASFIATQGVYGAVIFVLTFFATGRKWLPALISTIVAVVLGIICAQVIYQAFAGRVDITQKQDMGIVTFVLYLVYGGIYALALAIGRKIAKVRAGSAS